MQHLEVNGAVRRTYESLGVKRLIFVFSATYFGSTNHHLALLNQNQKKEQQNIHLWYVESKHVSLKTNIKELYLTVILRLYPV